MKKNGNNKGFTLIEVVVAAAILALVVLPICSGFVSVARVNAGMRESEAERRIMENCLEEIKATGKFMEIDVDDALDGVDVVIGDITIRFKTEKVSAITKSEKTAYYRVTLTSGHNTLEGVYLPR